MYEQFVVADIRLGPVAEQIGHERELAALRRDADFRAAAEARRVSVAERRGGDPASSMMASIRSKNLGGARSAFRE